MLATLAVGYDNEACLALAQQIAIHLGLTIDNLAHEQLRVTSDGLVLKIKPFLPMYVNFNAATLKNRHAAGRKQGLVAACKPAKGITILDTTAGWGKDAAILASFGATVLMLERQPVMALMLADALQRQAMTMSNALDLSVRAVDALTYLTSLTPADYPDVIYIDPMHPKRQKSALVKKELQLLQRLIGVDSDAKDLLILARQRTRQKVVVKWPQGNSPLLPPCASIRGRTVRFDIYTHVT
jgi:16S rRNA (guanine1516-N2)-methyltransferase